MNILVTGNYETGSSALLDYLREFKTVKLPFNQDQYEHTIFYMPHGIIELENILFSETGYISVDAVIRNFLKMSENIYKYDYKFYGGYKKYIGKEFIKMTNDFVDEITTKFDARTIGKMKKMYFSIVKGCGQIVYAILKGYKIHNWGMAYRTDKGPCYVLKVNHDDFIKAKQKYIAKYLELTKAETVNSLYDHLLLPMNVEHIKDFPKDSKVIIVERDPRDMYHIIKNVYINNPKNGYEKPPFPIDNVKDYINSFLMFRRGQKTKYENKNIYY